VRVRFPEIFARDGQTFSFEFFPPKTEEATNQLFAHIARLEALKPTFVTVTYGAGGSTRQRTGDVIRRIQRQHPALDPVAHLTCVLQSRGEMEEILTQYARSGVSNILALGGDPPRGASLGDRGPTDFHHAIDLVRFIRAFNARGIHPHRDGFGIGVAGFPEGHPATPNRLMEMDYLKAKVDAGADYICTQLFFDNRDFYDFCERCELAGIHVPVLAGIMPYTSVAGMKRMAELALGARYPAALLRAVARCGNDAEAVRRVGILWASEQCRDLLDQGVKGIHFYTMNRAEATEEIYANLGVTDSVQLRATRRMGC
jgi:methylenetetrahydrofolate reductase (NADPH)